MGHRVLTRKDRIERGLVVAGIVAAMCLFAAIVGGSAWLVMVAYEYNVVLGWGTGIWMGLVFFFLLGYFMEDD